MHAPSADVGVEETRAKVKRQAPKRVNFKFIASALLHMPPNPCAGTPRKSLHRIGTMRSNEPDPTQRRRRSHSPTLYPCARRRSGAWAEGGTAWIYVREARVLGERPAWHGYDMAIFLGMLPGHVIWPVGRGRGVGGGGHHGQVVLYFIALINIKCVALGRSFYLLFL